MAITTLYSSPTPHSPPISLPPLPIIPSLKTHISSPTPSLHPSSSNPSSSHCKTGSISISDDAITMSAALEAVTLATAAAQAANEAVALAYGVGEVWFGRQEKNEGDCGVGQRRESRRRRRRMMKGIQCLEMEETDFCFEGNTSVVGSDFLSLEEERELCMYLKEGEKVEAPRKIYTEAQGNESNSKNLIKVMRGSRRSIDNMICRRREARERITRSYQRFIYSIANGYQGKGLSLQDLVQEGSIGLLRGAEKFDPNRGNKLSTYVYWWIRQAIIRAIANKSRVVRLPGKVCGMVPKIAEANNILRKRLRRMPTFDEIAEMLNLQASTVRLVFEKTRLPISLDRVVTDRGNLKLQDIVHAPDETRPEYMVKKQNISREMEELLQSLSERESQILTLHFGLNGETPQSCEEIGKTIELSRERVRQIKGIALTKLQQRSNVDDMRFYIV